MNLFLLPAFVAVVYLGADLLTPHIRRFLRRRRELAMEQAELREDARRNGLR